MSTSHTIQQVADFLREHQVTADSADVVVRVPTDDEVDRLAKALATKTRMVEHKNGMLIYAMDSIIDHVNLHIVHVNSHPTIAKDLVA